MLEALIQSTISNSCDTNSTGVTPIAAFDTRSCSEHIGTLTIYNFIALLKEITSSVKSEGFLDILHVNSLAILLVIHSMCYSLHSH